MSKLSFFENMIENRLLNLHTAFLAKVISVKENTAKIQPLTMSKAYGEKAQKQSPLSDVPMLDCVKDLSAKDVVLCVCCERDITQAKNGKYSVPALRHHSMSDSIIVGKLKR